MIKSLNGQSHIVYLNLKSIKTSLRVVSILFFTIERILLLKTIFLLEHFVKDCYKCEIVSEDTLVNCNLSMLA